MKHANKDIRPTHYAFISWSVCEEKPKLILLLGMFFV